MQVTIIEMTLLVEEEISGAYATLYQSQFA